MKKYILFFVLFIGLLEIGLRGLGIFDVYTEKLGEKYRSYWGFQHKGHYKILPKNSTVEFQQKEFSVSYTTNSFGMRNPEITAVPKDSTVRILCLGDSFTQGDGATNGHSFPRVLERLLNLNGTDQRFEVINAGSNGSDLLYSERLLVDVAFSLQPKLVLIVINDSDVEDLIQRGGLERFKSNNTTQFKKGPWYEPVYAKSYVFRLIIHGVFRKSKLFLSPKEEKKAIAEANQEIEQSFLRITDFCDQRDIQVRYVIHPYPSYGQLKASNKTIPYQIDVRHYNQMLQDEQRKNGYVYDLNNALLDSLQQLPYEAYAWPINGHFNDNGYKIMAEEIYRMIKKDNAIQIN